MGGEIRRRRRYGAVPRAVGGEEDLRRRIRGGAARVARARVEDAAAPHLRQPRNVAQPEVADPAPAARVEQQVLWLEVAVRHAEGVHVHHARDGARKDVEAVLLGQRADRLEEGEDVAAVAGLHHEAVDVPFGVSHARVREEADEVRVARRGDGLVDADLEWKRPANPPPVEHLDGHVPPARLVRCVVDLRAGACADDTTTENKGAEPARRGQDRWQLGPRHIQRQATQRAAVREWRRWSRIQAEARYLTPLRASRAEDHSGTTHETLLLPVCFFCVCPCKPLYLRGSL